ncbi:fimbrial protein [Vibrio sp. TH_r3]|uniref:fimbrial protein n=1 Tax=Vibrio sp. TH_r3 TaxID=3082084 RepID=UPI002954E8C5|nr:fimbrial protein [Vibrio sp. TH_r3]MDV7104491.1 fimbrial protein [Vibrio sp. TH_r3]
MKTLNLALLPIISVFSTSVLATQANIITFQGEVTDQTCTVDVNGDTANPVVLLPTVSTSDLASVAAVAGTTEFDISISGCTAGATTDISTVFIGNQVTTDGNLGNTGSATEVDIQLIDTQNNVIDFSSDFNGNGDLNLADATATTANATYKAQYYATGATTAGTVSASLQYAISYQ